MTPKILDTHFQVRNFPSKMENFKLPFKIRTSQYPVFCVIYLKHIHSWSEEPLKRNASASIERKFLNTGGKVYLNNWISLPPIEFVNYIWQLPCLCAEQSRELRRADYY